MRRVLTIGILVAAVAVMAIVGITAPKSGATSALCHSNTLSIVVSASGVAPGKSITVTGGEPQQPAHSVTATLQSRRSTSKKWIKGASANLGSGGSYALKWTAPAKKGTYKIRVLVSHSGASKASTVKTVAVR